jgi:hypothetical protein
MLTATEIQKECGRMFNPKAGKCFFDEEDTPARRSLIGSRVFKEVATAATVRLLGHLPL